MPTLRNEQRLVLGLGMLVFLLSCTYVPWERRMYQTVFVSKADAPEPRTPDVQIEYHSIDPTETHYGWVFRRPVLESIPEPPGYKGTGISLSWELNVQFLVVEWLGICLITGALIWLLQKPRRAPIP